MRDPEVPRDLQDAMTFTTEAAPASPPTLVGEPGTHPGDASALRIVVLSGNPRAGSRTAATGRAAADAIAHRLAPGRSTAPRVEVVELADLAHEVLAAEHPAADAVLADLARADVVAVPLVVSGNPAHALAGEVHLRPLLVELGAVVPTRALSVTESDLADPAVLDTVLERWLADAAPALSTTVRTETPR